MKINIFKKGFNYSQDGTGNRLIYHLQGCNMNCPWCANPEGIDKNGSLVVRSELLLDSICPNGAIKNQHLNRDICKGCLSRECIALNKNMGIKLSHEEFEVESILEEAIRSSALFYEGGGVTFSGGEPTLQYEALAVLLEKLQERGIHTAIETNATHPRLRELFPFIDMLIMDLKHYDDSVHANVTGVGNDTIKNNIAKAMETHKNILIRIPVIKGFNHREEDIVEFARFFSKLPAANTSFEILPYHEFGKAKWVQCGMKYMMKNAFIGRETLALYEKIFAMYNIKVVHT